MEIVKVIKIKKVPGLYYIENFIDDDINIISKLDNQEWKSITNSQNSRLVQHYGYIYNYSNYKSNTKTIDMIPCLVDIKNDIKNICIQLNICDDMFNFDQCICNNYYKDQKISKHIDSLTFDKIICCLTLGNEGCMRFSINDIKHDIIVNPKSLYIMSGDARYKWTHEMLSNKGDRRISITYRKVIKN
jgi:alkylated DNA repair dioxygenase AlkB